MRTCKKCAEVKPLDQFGKTGRGYLKHECRACSRKYYREWVRGHSNFPAKYIEYTYKLTPDKYVALLQKQNGVCGICRRPDLKLVVDHDHACCDRAGSCGKCVRGLICVDCNIGLGRMHDNVTALQNAIEYLTKNTR